MPDKPFVPDQDDGHLEYRVTGRGAPGLLFLNGFRMHYKSWEKVCTGLDSGQGVLLFNRRGVGSSAKARVVQTGDQVIEDMRSLLSVAGFGPPYLLVAHSLGGLFANLFARRYPDEVSALVLVDATHPQEVLAQRACRPPWLPDRLNQGLKSVEKLFDRYKFSEDEAVEETLEQIRDAEPFPEIPVAVVTGCKKMPFVPAAAFETHLSYQTRLLDLSTESRHYLCRESGHFPQITEPGKVISAILETLGRI